MTESADELAERFERMAVDRASALRDFMLELSIGPTCVQWLGILQPLVRDLVEAARPQKGELSRRLASFERAMMRVAKASVERIAGTARDELLAEYDHLARTLPAAFGLDAERERREPVLVRHLVDQVPGASAATLEGLSRAGLGSLGALLACSADDLVTRARLDRELAESIRGHVQAYWEQRTRQVLTKVSGRASQEIREMADALSRAHDAFQRAEATEDRVAKRQARSERRSLALGLNALLAQLGELELVNELEPLPTARRVQRVLTHLEQATHHTLDVEEAS